MPSGIILASSSQGATQEAVEKVLTAHGYEADKPEVVAPEEPVEPKRDDFKTDAEFTAAQEEFEAAQETAEQEREEKEEKDAEARERERRPSRKQRAIDKATKKLQDDLKAANDRIAALEGKKPAAAEPKLEAPKREAFKSDQEFDDAMFDYRYQLRRQKEQAEDAQKNIEARLKANFTDYQTEVAAFKEEHDDWDEVVGKSIPISDPVYYAIVELAKDGPAVTYYLGQHPEEIDRLAELTPYAAAIAVGRLADKLKTAKKPAAKATPRPRPHIPEPVKPVRTAASASTLTSAEAAKSKDFKAFKQAQRAGR
jgi:hypothetical protein